MSLERLLRQPLTIEHREVSSTNEDGDDVLEVIGTDEVLGYVSRGALGRGELGAELLVDRETYSSDWILVLAAGATIDARARILYGEQAFEVVGEPHRVWNPRTASEHHVEARLIETVG